MKSAHKQIKSHLQSGKRITPIQALNMFGSFRLSAIIFRLRKEGLDIKTDMITKGKKTFAQYYI